MTGGRQILSRWGPALTDACIVTLLEKDVFSVKQWWDQHWPSLLLSLQRGTLEASCQLLTLVVDEFCNSFDIPMNWAMPGDHWKELAQERNGTRQLCDVDEPEICCGRMYRHAALNGCDYVVQTKELDTILCVGLFRLRGFGEGVNKGAFYEKAEEIWRHGTYDQWNALLFAFALQTLYGVFWLYELAEYVDDVRQLYVEWGPEVSLALTRQQYVEEVLPEERPSSAMMEYGGNGRYVY